MDDRPIDPRSEQPVADQHFAVVTMLTSNPPDTCHFCGTHTLEMICALPGMPHTDGTFKPLWFCRAHADRLRSALTWELVDRPSWESTMRRSHAARTPFEAQQERLRREHQEAR